MKQMIILKIIVANAVQGWFSPRKARNKLKLINRIIKILIEYKYKKDPFMAWSWGIDEAHEIHILTAEYYQDHYRYGLREEWYKAESEEKK